MAHPGTDSRKASDDSMSCRRLERLTNFLASLKSERSKARKFVKGRFVQKPTWWISKRCKQSEAAFRVIRGFRIVAYTRRGGVNTGDGKHHVFIEAKDFLKFTGKLVANLSFLKPRNITQPTT